MTTFFLTSEPPRGDQTTTNANNTNNNNVSDKKKSSILSEDEGSQSGSVSSWPFSRPPSLSHFDDVDVTDRLSRNYDESSFGLGSSYFEIPSPRIPSPRIPSNLRTSSPLRSRLFDYGSGEDAGQMKEQDPAPELNLVMPRVDLPTRKPFTPGGLRLGKLKVLVAGSPKAGKSQLIKAMVDMCQDIVLADDPVAVDSEIVETTASTKPFPLHWLASHERRKSHATATSMNNRSGNLIESLESVTSSDGVLDRNICFVDTSGPGAQAPDRAIQYLETQFRQTANVVNALEPQIVSLFTSASSLSEFAHVDVCLYVISGSLSEDDIECMAEIGEFTPVVPVIAKSDLMTRHELLLAKMNVLHQLKESGLDPFLFDVHVDEAIEQGQRIVTEYEHQMSSSQQQTEPGARHVVHMHPFFMPCGVSSKHVEVMTESRVDQPESTHRVHSELCDLLRYMVSEHGSAWLRYVTAQKFLSWHNKIQATQLIPYGYQGAMSLARPYQHQMSESPKFTSIEVSTTFLQNDLLLQTNNNKAQNSMVKWAVVVEQMSRTENAAAVAVAVRNRSKSVRQRPRPRMVHRAHSARHLRASRSIHGVDPLNLSSWWRWSVCSLVRALSMLVGLRLTYHLYCRYIGSSSTSAVATSGIGAASGRATGLHGLLSSLGGGWSVLV